MSTSVQNTTQCSNRKPLHGLIAIGGGIGSGKSVVSRILRTMCYHVYDCDSRARFIVDNTPEIIERIGNEVCAQAVSRNNLGNIILNRNVLAEAVFSDKNKLQKLNTITHAAVLSDLQQWYAKKYSETTRRPLFVESAIIKESRLDELVEKIWLVSAPVSLRIQRVATRDNHSREHILKRIKSQSSEFCSEKIPVCKIVNDDRTALLPQILFLLKQ